MKSWQSSVSCYLRAILLVSLIVGSSASVIAQESPLAGIRAQWGSFFGGGSSDQFNDVKMLSDGSFVVVGSSTSTSIPPANEAVTAPRRAKSGGQDGIVARFNADYSLAWYTYVGGAGYDDISSVVVDGGNIYILGTTNSNEQPGNMGDAFPITGAVPQPVKSGGDDQFVGCLNGSTGAINWLSYKGGTGNDIGNRLSVRSVKVGSTITRLIAGVGDSNGGFPTSPTISGNPCGGGAVPLQSDAPGQTDATIFVWTELAGVNGVPTGAEEFWSTYLGGSSNDIATACEIGSAGDIFVGGYTESPGPSQASSGTVAFPAQGGNGVITTHFTSNTGNAQDGFVAKFSPLGCLLSAGFIGGTANDVVTNGGIDSKDNFYLVGRTLSDNFSGISLLSAGAGQRDRGGDPTLQTGGVDAFVAVFDKDCNLQRSTYFGGAGDEFGFACAVVETGTQPLILVAGETYSNNSPTTPECGSTAQAIQAKRAGSNDKNNTMSDQFIAAYTPDCCRMWGSYYGGTKPDMTFGIAAEKVNADTRIVLAGETFSNDYPVVAGPAGSFNQPVIANVVGPDATILALVANSTSSAPEALSATRMSYDPPVPNPVSTQVGLRFTLANPGIVSIEIFAVDGRRAALPIEGRMMNAGDHAEQVSVASLSPGVYTARITTNGEIGIAKFVVVR
jgi:hypothetical protein